MFLFLWIFWRLYWNLYLSIEINIMNQLSETNCMNLLFFSYSWYFFIWHPSIHRKITVFDNTFNRCHKVKFIWRNNESLDEWILTEMRIWFFIQNNVRDSNPIIRRIINTSIISILISYLFYNADSWICHLQ